MILKIPRRNDENLILVFGTIFLSLISSCTPTAADVTTKPTKTNFAKDVLAKESVTESIVFIDAAKALDSVGASNANAAIAAVNAAITAVATSQGYSMVLDGNIAGQNGIGLVVYAAEGLDITDQVIENIE